MSYKQRVPKHESPARGLLSTTAAPSTDDLETGSSSSAALVDESEKEVQGCIRLITAKTSAVERCALKVKGGDEKATHELREEIEEIKGLAARAQRELDTMDPAVSASRTEDPALKEQKRVKYLKLKKNLELSLAQFHAASTEALAVAKTQAEIAQNARCTSLVKEANPQEHTDVEELPESAYDHVASDELVMAAAEMQFNDELLAERETDIRGIQSDIEGIKKLYKDLAVHVTTQGDDLDNIEANMEQTVGRTEQARDEIVISQNSQRRRSKTYCCLLVACVITLTVLIIVLTAK
eukprot:GEMP01017862.1.p1 GENE.GEMP01017862.1~~GEMP01017862.1.p1  ORF type:complete len:296 (+),score=71.38 GEMP01017862.1:145-1032(+)